jgi:hypothetical protein
MPADWVIVAFFGVLACAYALATVRFALGNDEAWQSFDSFRVSYLWGAAALYAFFRLAYFHPVENRPYGAWLINSPWHYPEPLPLGPLELVWQDVVVVGVLSALFPRDGDSFSLLWLRPYSCWPTRFH